MLTPATVHHDPEAAALAARHAVMLAAYSANPDRFAAGEPKLAMLPAEVGSTSQTTTSSPRDHTTSPPLLASERLTCSALDPLDPKWSPHGSSIALVRARDLGSDGGYGGSFLNEWVRQRTLWLQNSDGREPTSSTVSVPESIGLNGRATGDASSCIATARSGSERPGTSPQSASPAASYGHRSSAALFSR